MNLDFPTEEQSKSLTKPTQPPVSASPRPTATPRSDPNYTQVWEQVGIVADTAWRANDMREDVTEWAKNIVEAENWKDLKKAALEETFSWSIKKAVKGVLKHALQGEMNCQTAELGSELRKFCDGLVEDGTDVITNIKAGISGSIERARNTLDLKKRLTDLIEEEISRPIRDFNYDMNPK